MSLQPAKPGAELCRLLFAAFVRTESALVDLTRDEFTHVGVHAPRLRDEDTLGVGNRYVFTQDVLQHAVARRARVLGFGDLRELQWVSQEQHIARAISSRQGVG